MRRSSIDACLLLLLLLPGLAAALESDRRQPLQVKADRVELDNRQGISIFRGHVVFDQGSLHLEADRLTAHRSGTTIDRIEADGSPVRFRQRVGRKDILVQGSARHVDYRSATGRIVLQGAAQVQRGADHMSGEHIEYDMRLGTVIANGGADHRVHAVIHPRQPSNAGDKTP